MASPPDTVVITCPFDQFGNSGTASGAQLLSDFLLELVEDSEGERHDIRAHCYRDKVRFQELAFADVDAIQTWQPTSRKMLRKALKANDRVIWLGGNHLSVLPVYEELGTRPGTVVVQFDAHLDIYTLHDVTDHPANGNFLLHADGPLPAIVNLGHRDLYLKPAEIHRHFASASSSLAVSSQFDRTITDLRQRLGQAKRVWIDIDADAFDPAAVPGVHHPLPCGLSSSDVLRLLNVIYEFPVIGLSVSEFDAGRDVRDQSLSTLGWLLEWCLLRWYERG